MHKYILCIESLLDNIVIPCGRLTWLDARCSPKLLYHSPPCLDRGERKGSWVEVKTEGNYSLITIMDKTNTNWGKFVLIYDQSNQSRIMRNKTKSSDLVHHPSLLPRLNFSPDFLYRLPHSRAGGQEMWVLVSLSHSLPLLTP